MITQLTDKCIAVEVPADTVAWEMHDKECLPLAVLIFRNDPQGLFKPGIPEPIFPIPTGNWSILGRPNELKEEEAKLIVEAHSATIYGGHGPDRFDGYKDYCNTSEYPLLLPISSFKSLLKSKNVNPESVIILIKQ